MSWSLHHRTKAPRKHPWHRDPAVLAETLNRVPIAVGGVLAVAAVVGFLAWLGVPAIWDAAEEGAWGTAVWRVVEATLGTVFCFLVGFLVGKALGTLFLRLGLRLADARWARALEDKWESLRTQAPERRY